MRVIANSQLRGEYGTVVPDQEFDVRDEVANELLKSGMVRHATPPRVEYETKVITPEAPEVGPRQPFRDVLVPNPKQEDVVAEGNPVLSAANLSSGGTPDFGRRGGRSRSRSGR
jgi:hypothetical protein